MRTFTRVNRCSDGMIHRAAFIFFTLLIFLASEIAHAEWGIDLSRRTKEKRETELINAGQSERGPASVRVGDESGVRSKDVLDMFFDAGEPVQDLVIIHTDRGFVPSTVRVRAGGRYRISIVNVNEKEKNVSFILDGFSEHHATYFGRIKTFMLEPKVEGAFSFQSPETSAEGKLVVFSPQQVMIREPASQGTGQ